MYDGGVWGDGGTRPSPAATPPQHFAPLGSPGQTAGARGRFNPNPQTVGVELTNPVTFNCVMVHLTL